MNILGLDMSSKKTGYSFFQNGILKDYGVWEVSSQEITDWRERLKIMARHINIYIEAGDIDEIIVEDVPPILENTQTVKVLSALQGMLISIGVSHNIKITFIPVKTWKTKLGINLVSSKENNMIKKKVKADFGAKNLQKLKGWTKAWEKKLSVDCANHIYNLNLIYKSPSSKYNDDDIADSINIVHTYIEDKPYKYDLDSFENIMNNFYNIIQESEK